jgi:hypothetical protein
MGEYSLCVPTLLKNALSLIKEITEENERLVTALANYAPKPIVHCEDCHWAARDVRGHIYCFKHAGCILRNNDDFCSRGKIK